ncbi:hypothetical protein [Sporosarcina sp. Marseille-Q4943]|uniref:hypothetical protein n=1 Tax=Sporosarcina sp. Marseille-Q4943 TaxID=2942204 RepID=UPI00208DBFE5|nr:hypothetical protein [Sporosarcina sp. Marseille-Q4943]
MRRKIIAELAKQYVKEEREIIQSLYKSKRITPYITRNVKNRLVIDKTQINIEELIILDYYKLLLNKYCNLKFPNRSYIMAEIMNIVPDLHCYHAYTIYKFDFQDFFNTVSSIKSFDYLCEALDLRTYEYDFLKKYTNTINKLIPGIGLHNTLVEIMGENFDLEVKKAFKESCLYYARYVDDCILILDERVDRSRIEEVIFKLMSQCFGNKLKVNNIKTDYYNSLDTKIKFDYLGYEFKNGQSVKSKFQFGIAENKLNKYTVKLNDIVLEYKETNNIEVLSYKLEIFFKRIVYFGVRKNSNKYRWQVRGFSDSYKELKRFMTNNNDFSRITSDTKNFFTRTIERRFTINQVAVPAEINNQLKNNKFISCFLKDRTVLLHRRLGLTHEKLKQKLYILDNGNSNFENDSYNELAKKMLTIINK